MLLMTHKVRIYCLCYELMCDHLPPVPPSLQGQPLHLLLYRKTNPISDTDMDHTIQPLPLHIWVPPTQI